MYIILLFMQNLMSYLQKQVSEFTDDKRQIPELKCFIQKSLHLSWKLATCCPPMISSCSDEYFDQKKHKRSKSVHRMSQSNTLEYLSPVLYYNYMGGVARHGKVVAKSEDISCSVEQGMYVV